jgi:phosphohistidine swiveling domain-containing protein
MLFVPATDLDTNATIGGKALRLMELKRAGYMVPDFVVLPNETVMSLSDHGDELETLCTQIATALPSKRYAVRSAAITEDTKEGSMAGQFLTKLDVMVADLAGSILAVVTDAKNKTEDTFRFSVIVQMFVEPECAGVLFTRDPQGGSGMVLEYRSGRGDAVVGGAVVEHLQLLPGEAVMYKQTIPFLGELVELGQALEKQYDWPQDIEWAVRGGVLFVLQTRPITSITAPDWEGMKYMDHSLGGIKNYLFAQTAVSETFYRPRPLAFSMLNQLYAPGGPIEATYKKLGVTYTSRDQFRLFGTDLYVDRQAEIQTLYPSYGYLVKRSAVPKRETWMGYGQTFMNQLALARLSLAGEKALQAELYNLLVEPVPTGSLVSCFDFFLKKYSLIFEVNLKAEKAIQQYSALTRDTAQSFMQPTLLGDREELVSMLAKAGLIEGSLIGNSISIDDRSPFTSQIFAHTDQAALELPPLPAFKRVALEKVIQTANTYLALRELARLVGVRLMAEVRRAVDHEEEQHQVTPSGLLYFATLAEITHETFSTKALEARKSEYEKNEGLRFPSLIASFSSDQSRGTRGVSPGWAEGIVVTKEDMSAAVKPILLTDLLTPDLVAHFPSISGIIARQGGVLSHLAIMAREAGLPVVVTDKPVKSGDHICLDGTTGDITITERQGWFGGNGEVGGPTRQ